MDKSLTDIHQDYQDVPKKLTKHWVADCRPLGDGIPAFTYLAKYLYRGVISNRQLLHFDGQEVTWHAFHRQSGIMKRRYTLSANRRMPSCGG